MKKIPIGTDDFNKIRTGNYYYVDKTNLIKELIERGLNVALYTRPRRFGKTLNMSMLKSFFEIGADPKLFEGLAISNERELCEEYLGKYPVIFLTLKDVNGNSYEDAMSSLSSLISREARRIRGLIDISKLDQWDQKLLDRLLDDEKSVATIGSSLASMSELLEKHYGKKVVILIDEYDVPLDKAFQNGYYDEMVSCIRGMFSAALKTNPSLDFAVLTGCMRISKESVFTGLNNFKVCSIMDNDQAEYFSFTENEVIDLLHYYNMEQFLPIIKEWYDGFRFGDVDVYCPWDVINYCYDYVYNGVNTPKNYWVNTSGNDIINYFVDQLATSNTKIALEKLIAGGSIIKAMKQDLTYQELYKSSENLWNAMYTMGYLTQRESISNMYLNLVIPNLEIRSIIIDKILDRFRVSVANDGEMLAQFCSALKNGNAEMVEQLFTEYMGRTISVRDTFVKIKLKENFYHGMLLGILAYKEGWSVFSNKESGDGFSDILVEIDETHTGIVIELKYSQEESSLEKDCKEALKQIDNRRYTEVLHREGYTKILKYGLANHLKKCRVIVEEEKPRRKMPPDRNIDDLNSFQW